MKKAQGMPINVIVIAVIALLVLLILALIFSGYIGGFREKVKGEEEASSKTGCKVAGGECKESCTDKELELSAASCGNNQKCCIPK